MSKTKDEMIAEIKRELFVMLCLEAAANLGYCKLLTPKERQVVIAEMDRVEKEANIKLRAEGLL